MSSNIFSLSNDAVKRIADILIKKNDPNMKLRVSVEGGGCSGFKYKYEFVTDTPMDDELVIEEGEARVIVDPTSLEFLKDSILDFYEDLSGSYFKIKNPNAASGCGCGNSFSI